VLRRLPFATAEGYSFPQSAVDEDWRTLRLRGFGEQDFSMPDNQWTDYKVLLALGEGGSIAGAARLLGIDASTVSRRLAALEEALGAVLIIRGGRDFVFTSEGRIAMTAARGMLELAVSAAGAIRAAKTSVEGLVRISCVPGLAGPLLAFQASVEARYSRLHVEISADFERADLARGEADIALRMAEPREPDLIANQCFEIGLTVFAAKSYVARHGLPAAEAELSSHKLILYTKRFAELPAFSWIERYAAANAHTMRADGPDMMLGLVSAGGGIGIIDFHGDADPDLVRVFTQPSAFVRGWLVYHESARATARVKAVVEMLVAFLRAQAPLLSGRKD
jgi:DNA-binding transcriptional LysR family regulator